MAIYDVDAAIQILKEKRDQHKLLEAEIKSMSDKLQEYMFAIGEPEYTSGILLAELHTGQSASSIEIKRLLENGVSADIILKCTKAGTEYTYVTISDTTKKKTKE